MPLQTAPSPGHAQQKRAGREERVLPAEAPAPQGPLDVEEEEELGEGVQMMDRFTNSPWLDPPDDPVEIREIVATFGGHVMAYKGVLIRTGIAFMAVALLRSMPPMATKFVIDYIIPSRNYPMLWVTAAAVVGLFMLLAVLVVLAHYLLVFASTHVVFDVRRRLFEHLQLLHLAFYEKEKSGKLVAKLINDVASIQMVIQSALPVMCVACFTIVVSFILMTLLSPKLTVLAALVLPVYFIVTRLFHKMLYQRSMEVRERNSVVAGNLNEIISGIKIVKSFGQEDMEQKRFVRMIRENLAYEIDLVAAHARHGSTLEFITGLSLALVIVFGGGAAMGNQMSVGSYVAFISYLWMLFGPVIQIAGLMIQFVDARTGLQRVYKILNIKPQITDRERARPISKIEGHVVFEDVQFAYETGNPVLNGLDIEARPGEIVALVGPSGSGKSTVVNLLTRFYDVTGGRILVDGVDLRDLQTKSYRRHVGIVLQEPFLFSGTIFDNICYGIGWATREQVEEAARQANALEFINQLPDGMQTQVGERGSLLSGGQRQRISIARALLKDPDILILDEATSALDTESEAKVQEALDRLMAGRTVFVVAHRLSTIKNAHKIVVLNRGRVEAVGTHDELLAQGGTYANLYRQSFKSLT